jgi:hypothetical protein
MEDLLNYKTMTIQNLKNETIKSLLTAMNSSDKETYLKLFSKNAIMTDDGNKREVSEWAESEIFGRGKGHLTSIDKELNEGLTIYGVFHSNQWGNIKAIFNFEVNENLITRFDASQQ